MNLNELLARHRLMAITVAATVACESTAEVLLESGVRLLEVSSTSKAGALAVGVGSPRGGDAPHGGDLDALREHATRFVAAAYG